MSSSNIETNPARNKCIGFAKRGFPVLPVWGIEAGKCCCGRPGCESPGKHPIGPLTPRGLLDASTDGEIIAEWFDEHPSANYGVLTEKLPTIDIDPRNGGDVGWRNLRRKHFEPHTWRVATGGGGEHIICGALDKPVRSAKLARGVDLKASGGYIVGVGSLHVSGKRYAFYADCRPKNTQLAPLPEWIAQASSKSSGDKEPLARGALDQLVEDVFEGERNERMTRLIGHLFGAVRPDRVVLYRLALAWNNAHCHPPLSADEVLRIAESINGRECRKCEATR